MFFVKYEMINDRDSKAVWHEITEPPDSLDIFPIIIRITLLVNEDIGNA